MMSILNMCKLNEQTKRDKKDVEPITRRPIVSPNTTGSGIIQENK